MVSEIFEFPHWWDSYSFEKSALSKAVIPGFRFNHWFLWCPLQPCTKKSHCFPFTQWNPFTKLSHALSLDAKDDSQYFLKFVHIEFENIAVPEIWKVTFKIVVCVCSSKENTKTLIASTLFKESCNFQFGRIIRRLTTLTTITTLGPY